MKRQTAIGFVRGVKLGEEKTLFANRLNIGPRLILCFVLIILSMLAGDAVVLWQFHLVRAHAERLNGVDQKLAAVLRVHTSLLAFHDRLEELAESEDAGRVAEEAEHLRSAVLQDVQRANSALSFLPSDVQRDPTLLPTLHVIQSALPSQLEDITSLATAGDWRAVRARLANQIRPLESLTSAVVEKVDYEVGEDQAQTVLNIKRVERRVFLIVPMTAIFTLLIAGTLGLAITRSITQPLARLVEGSEALARGDFQHQVSIRGQDELAHLGLVFNDTAGRLRDFYAAAREQASLLDLTHDTVFSRDMDGVITYWNHGAEEQYGFTREEALGKVAYQLLEKTLPAPLDELMVELLRAGRWEGEVVHKKRDGTRITVASRWSLQRDKLGRPVAILETNNDITARKQVEEKLRQSEAYLANAQRVSRTGSFGWRISSGEIIWSEETYRIFEYDRTTKPSVEVVLQRVHPDDAARVKQTIERASQDGKDFDFEHRLLIPDGSVKYLQVVGHALGDEPGSREFVGAVMDVTERKRAEYLTGQVFQISPDGISVVGRDYRYRRVNPVYERHWEKPAEKIVGMHVADLLGTATFEQEIKPLLDRCFGGEEVSYGGWFGNALGRRYLAVSYSPLRPASERVEAALVISRDLTEPMLASERLRQAQTDLARISRVATVGEMTAWIAHEVNQPLTGVVAHAGTCMRWLGGEAPNLEEARAAAMKIVQDGTRAAEIISRIRALFKKGTLQRELVDVNEAIREMVDLLRSEAMRYSVSVRTDLAADIPQVMGDRVQLHQVLMNLMLNGIDAMKDMNAEGELTIKSQQAENGQLLISVSDTGVGLPAQKADQIFTAFFTTKPHGTGMGLSISRSIVESHGGRLWAADNSPRGATFHFTLASGAEDE